jgi:hypothetical protein
MVVRIGMGNRRKFHRIIEVVARRRLGQNHKKCP